MVSHQPKSVFFVGQIGPKIIPGWWLAKKHFCKQFKKWKSANNTARGLILVLAILILLVIVLIVGLLLQIRSDVNSSLEGEDNSGVYDSDSSPYSHF
jgi:membrane protease YdiL (CAAX protease family)